MHNSSANMQEALSVMDIDLIESTGNLRIVGAELAVSTLLSSLVRRNICPNFVNTRGVFTCAFPPPVSHWGDENNKAPKGKQVSGVEWSGGTLLLVGIIRFNSIINPIQPHNTQQYNPRSKKSFPRQPAQSKAGRYQYIRMELCSKGDVEEYIAGEASKTIEAKEAGQLLFQMAFSLHAAKEKFNLKHYDVKLLNFLLQDASASSEGDSGSSQSVCLQYALNDKVFNLVMPRERALIAKVS